MRFKAEISDQFQFLSGVYNYNDHQTHCVIDFENKINKEILKKAIILMLDIVPILGCVYVENKKNVYWEKVNDLKIENIMIFVNNKEEFDNFITSKTDEFIGPQMKVCVLDSDKDSLAIIINHMVCDGGGLKQCLYLLSDLYSNLIENPEYVPNYKINLDRSTKSIRGEFNLIEKIKIFMKLNKGMKNNNFYKFPMSGEKNAKPFVLKHKINEERYLKIKDYCKNYNVTVNDVFLAAYYRVIYKLLDINPEKPLTIPIMVDMRRKLKKQKINGICNCTSSIVTGIDYESDENFYDTVKKINKYMVLQKNKFMGIELFFKMSLISRIFSYEKIKILLEKKFENPFLCMSNIGVIDSEKFSFKGMSINEVFMFGSIKYPPYFQLAISTYNNTITLSVNLYGNSKDKKYIEHFFNKINMELPI